jgi:hypothetical protein
MLHKLSSAAVIGLLAVPHAANAADQVIFACENKSSAKKLELPKLECGRPPGATWTTGAAGSTRVAGAAGPPWPTGAAGNQWH